MRTNVFDMAVQPYSDLASAYPNLSGATSQVASNIARRLRGQLSPETQNAIQDASARFGITSGMPGSGLQNFRTARDLGRATEDLQRAGEQDFLQTLGAYSGTIAPTIGQQIQQRQFGQEMAFRQGEANRDYRLRQNQQDLAAFEANQRYAPLEYSQAEVFAGVPQYKYRFWQDRMGNTASNPSALMFRFRNR